MKFDRQSLIVGLAIGVNVGGAAIGYMDANRPKPLFSSADGIPCGPDSFDYVGMYNANGNVRYYMCFDGNDFYWSVENTYRTEWSPSLPPRSQPGWVPGSAPLTE